ncbi:phosphate ABC transporter substrate-binding protein PstS [Homoserinibacter sp. YIM 151385]|uniref:phosphate ABC transporter substrate-binding protein PstS n=1 Tax=Homoserinibacter sp. YIM 151385 TaxID=2985506 RepID=UPI0022F0E60D|nr:phosphate ABC transporter substrate-binding protein PstS [Homoserinibacter sp. YIM 151385]WBU39315.1 phosphate ABC transporter substrate-binding protein PstS [Homoserinibacter sp. YIM 151385]
MKISRFGAVGAIALVGTLALASCAANEPGASEETGGSDLTGTLVGAGASSQQSAQEAWIAAFQGDNPDVTIEYDPAGSGTGRDTFIAGASAFAGSDRAFKDEEIAAGEFGSCVVESGIVEIPAYISPIAVAFNLEGVESLNLDAATIAGIFAGDITNWSDDAIASQNDGVELPDLDITAVHRADDSGTTENFTEYLGQAAPEVWTDEADGVWPLEGGEAASQTSGVVDAVTGGTGTIGYMDASRVGDLGTVSVQVGEEYVAYSAEAAAAIVDASPLVEGRGEGDLAIELDRTSTEAGVYPIVLVSYLIGCAEYGDKAPEGAAELTKAYFEYIVSPEGQQAAAEAAGSAPISDTLQADAEAAIALIK